MAKRIAIESTAEAYLELLAARGVEYLFANAGTDFAPIIEAYAKRGAQGQALPRPITVPHEVPAVAMAHGYAMVTRRAQAVMVHVIVGAANALGGVINAARAQVPILFSAGRTPLSEGGVLGSRDRHIHWAQESYDQAGMAREFVKWDYELRNFAQIETVVDRALAMAQAEPPGPVYLTLPREVLAERHETLRVCGAEPPAEAGPASRRAGRHRRRGAAARRRAQSDHHHQGGGTGSPRRARAGQARGDAGRAGLPGFRTQLHELSRQPSAARRLRRGRASRGGRRHPRRRGGRALVPAHQEPAPGDPRDPGGVGPALLRLSDPRLPERPDARRCPAPDARGAGRGRGSPRRSRARSPSGAASGRPSTRACARRGPRAQRRSSKDTPIDMAWVSRCIADRIDEQTLVVNEYDLDTTQTSFRSPGTYFGGLAVERPRLGARRRARRQARRAATRR